MAGLYAHIPFCTSRCIYCAFCSSTKLALRGRYVDALLKEYALRKSYLGGEKIETIYLGGGTPSVLNTSDLARLLDVFLKDAEAEEITVECNPDDISRDFAKELVAMGVNRVSTGIQTFSPERLRLLRRRHTAEQAIAAVGFLREAGIENISIDLMFGFPRQTVNEWLCDVKKAVELAPEHISAYCLSIEPGTPLHAMLVRGELNEADDESCREMYYLLSDIVATKTFEHYEISNFCRPGFRAKHNSGYWHGARYLGLGAAAHSYDGRSRQWNTSDIEAYIDSIERGQLPFEREVLSADERYNDLITTALRTSDGIALDNDFYGRDYLLSQARPLLARGLLEVIDGRLRLTREALFTSDSVLAELVKV
ncbi:MAG: radical SAM family heme chaperone HemW [Prevotella sp.]|nr:radical SAM family heme chaperone HemW [Prevotella sp.]